jgi:hypothetical protein
MAKKKIEEKSEVTDMVKLYEMYFDFIQQVHGLELTGILELPKEKTEKHSLAIDFLQRTFNQFLKLNNMNTINPTTLGVVLVLMNTISVQIEKTH